MSTAGFLYSEGGNRCAAVISHEVEDGLRMWRSLANKALKQTRLKKNRRLLQGLDKQGCLVWCASPSPADMRAFERLWESIVDTDFILLWRYGREYAVLAFLSAVCCSSPRAGEMTADTLTGGQHNHLIFILQWQKEEKTFSITVFVVFLQLECQWGIAE